VAKNWDNNKTVKENYSSMGIDMLDGRTGRKGAESQARNASLLADNPDMVLDAMIPESGKVKTESIFWDHDQANFNYKACKFLSMQEAYQVKAMIDKHGDDYSAMARDMKMNQQQLTAGQLRRKCAMFAKEVNAGGSMK
jgi:hypothetical protein